MLLWFGVAKTGLVPGHASEMNAMTLQSPNRTGTVGAAGPGIQGRRIFWK